MRRAQVLHPYTLSAQRDEDILKMAKRRHEIVFSCGARLQAGIRDGRIRQPDRGRYATLHNNKTRIGYFFSTISTDARVVSQSSFMVHAVPVESKEIVKFSSGAGSFETFISARVKS